MTDLLQATDAPAVTHPTPTPVQSSIEPIEGAAIGLVRPSRRDNRRRPGAEIAASTPVQSILAGLRLGAPALLDRAGAATQERFVDLVSRRLALYLGDALTVFRVRVGDVAAGLAQSDRMTLQDLVLTSRPCVDALVPIAAGRLSPSQLVAILATSCQNHAPSGFDSRRCREAVYGGDNPLAREAMLDLASDDIEDGIRLTCERVVTEAMTNRLAAQSLPEPILACLAAPRDATPSRTTRPSVARARRVGGVLPVREQLAQALAGRNASDPIALLASAAGVARETVDAAICLRSPKGLASLAWRAGFDAAFAATLQRTLARIPPDQVLHPTASGAFPLTEPEMLWQCRYLARSLAD